MRARATKWVFAAVLGLVGSGCSSDGPDGAAPPVRDQPTGLDSTTSVSSDSSRALPASDGEVQIDLSSEPRQFDARLLGTNAPAWIAPERLADPTFQQQMVDMGTTVVRMPGGSWSSSYDWLGCETRDASTCEWTWASRPSDYLTFLSATGIDGMWTVNFNGTAEEAAALVAFFNGEVDDDRAIGIDRNGRDWKTVGTWAQLRADGGHLDPASIGLWEIGNEVYGATSDASGDCASFGWEDVWTCDGDEYISGDDTHDGFLEFREQMLAVDPDILVGAVGIGGSQGEWSNFGNEVIESAGDALDFYIVHDYGFDDRTSTDEVLRRPARAWPRTMGDVKDALAEQNPDRDVPVAVTEYNMFAFADGDTDGLMSQAVSALYIADTIGQMAEQGVSMANQWNIVNGVTETGSDYGLLHPDTGAPYPQYFGMAMWHGFGDRLLTVDSDIDDDVSVFAGRRSSDDVVTVLVINNTDDEVVTDVVLGGADTAWLAASEVTVDVLDASTLDGPTIRFNGADSAGGAEALDAGPQELGAPDSATLSFSFAPLSITRVRIGATGGEGSTG